MRKQQKQTEKPSRPKHKYSEDMLDEALSETFPASDPISVEVLREEDAEAKKAERMVDK
jgi:hypothetical protein